MRKTVQRVCSHCAVCQAIKPTKQKFGYLPEKEPDVEPWKTLCIDLIGPYTIGKGQHTTVLYAMTMIDPATGWFEICEIPKRDSFVAATTLEAVWLNRYPWPEQVVLDRGKEFMGEVKRMLKQDYGLIRRPITTRNPQANAMVERAHQTLHAMIRSRQVRDKRDLPLGWTGVLNACRFAMNSTVHTTTRATPMQLVFGRDSILPIKFQADWELIKARKLTMIEKNNDRENEKRIPYEYKIGDKVGIYLDPTRKHGADKAKGPFTITRVYDNGTVRLRQRTQRGGAVHQTWNIRNIFPYKA
jgi:transposase InsO family protein